MTIIEGLLFYHLQFLSLVLYHIATVNLSLSLFLSFGLMEGPVEVTVLDVDGFTTFSLPLFCGLVPFTFPAGPLPCPPEATFKIGGFALTLLPVTTTGCCRVMWGSVVVTTACKSLYFFQ